MNTATFQYRNELPQSFHPDSRVWIYQSDRIFNAEETDRINSLLQQFTSKWTSHGAPVKGYGLVFFSKFIVLMADETVSGVSGCSTDSSVKLIRDMEAAFGLNLFGRENLAFLKDGTIIEIRLSAIKHALEEQVISPETLYFNNLVSTKKEFEDNWILELKSSWLKSRL